MIFLKDPCCICKKRKNCMLIDEEWYCKHCMTDKVFTQFGQTPEWNEFKKRLDRLVIARDALSDDKTYSPNCVTCGEIFYPKYHHKKYCSIICKKAKEKKTSKAFSQTQKYKKKNKQKYEDSKIISKRYKTESFDHESFTKFKKRIKHESK